MKQLRHNKTSVVNINYHIVFCPKYRRKVLVDGVDERLKEILANAAEEMGCTIKTMEVMPDHVHIYMNGSPTIPVHLIVKNLKAISSKKLREEFPSLNSRLPSLWTRSYYCETIGCIDEEAIEEYIEEQKYH